MREEGSSSFSVIIIIFFTSVSLSSSCHVDIQVDILLICKHISFWYANRFPFDMQTNFILIFKERYFKDESVQRANRFPVANHGLKQAPKNIIAMLQILLYFTLDKYFNQQQIPLMQILDCGQPQIETIPEKCTRGQMDERKDDQRFVFQS